MALHLCVLRMLPLFKKAMLAALGAGLLFPAIAQAETSKPATAVTAKVNRAVLNELPFADARSFEDARRGFVGALPNGRVVDEEGHVVWDMEPYAFLNKACGDQLVHHRQERRLSAEPPERHADPSVGGTGQACPRQCEYVPSGSGQYSPAKTKPPGGGAGRRYPG